LNQVIICANGQPPTILENHNTFIEGDNFISTFNLALLAQLPFNAIESVVVYIFLHPGMPIKFSFPLDESDDLVNFNVNISPNELLFADFNEDEFLNMCASMSTTTL
jgi:hypothetical protein